MDRTLVLAAGFSAALHAGLLLGPNRGPVPKAVVKDDNVTVYRITMPPDDPPEPEVVVDTKADRTPTPEQLVPRSAEPVVASPPDAFTQRPVPEVPVVSNLRSLSTGNLEGTLDTLKRVSIITSGMLDNPPRVRAQVAPIYPAEPRRLGQTGRVLVEFLVDEEGHVHDPRVMSSSDRVFEDATLRAISRWRFEPGRKDGRVVRFRMAVPIEFTLSND